MTKKQALNKVLAAIAEVGAPKPRSVTIYMEIISWRDEKELSSEYRFHVYYDSYEMDISRRDTHIHTSKLNFAQALNDLKARLSEFFPQTEIADPNEISL